jgi:hypothetical protein
MRRKRAGWLAILAGAALALGVQIAAPVGVPLYDGVLVQEPYRYLDPAGDQVGEPSSFGSTPAVVEGVSPIFAAATLEEPPQAQLIARRDAFALAPGTTSLQVSITPIEPPAPPPEGTVAGNTYRFRVTDQAGNDLPVKPCEACLSLVLRAPEDTEVATVKRFADALWLDVETVHAGIGAMYQANPTAMGDYAVIDTAARAESGIDLTLVALGFGLALVFVAFIGLVVVRARPAPTPIAPRGRGEPGGRVPSKRKRPRRPPGGRSGE